MRRIALLAFAVVACAAPAVSPVPAPASRPRTASIAPPAAAKTVRRVVVSLKRTSGSSVATTAPDGLTTIAFDVLENGRGPHSDARLRVAADGTIASFEAHGHHEMGLQVDETFAVEGGHARWKSREESGERNIESAAFFVPVSDLPDVLGLLASALLRAPGGTLPLLPGGEAHIEKTGEVTVEAAGARKHLTSYAITGLELTPSPVWMEDDGTWFGVVDPTFSVVPEGWASAIDALVAKQIGYERERDRRVAERLAHKPPAAGVALVHARVLDVERGTWLDDHIVVVVGDRIRAVGPSRATRVPEGAETIDVGGAAILPGLWDMHSHLGPADGALDIASGVTTARDVGNSPDRLDDFKKRFDDGTAVGPHVLRQGIIEGRGEKAASSEVTAETEAEARAAVEFYARRGYEGIKIYNSVRPELVPLLAKEAHARGMSVTGHVPVHMLAREAVLAGYDGIEHVNMLFLNFFADHDTDTRTTVRFSLVAEKAADFDLKGKSAHEFFALLREHHTVVDPTVGAFEDVFVGQQGKVIPGLEPIVERLPVMTQRAFLLGGLPMEGKQDLYRRSYEKMIAMVRALHDAGVTVIAGTDALAGLMLHHELELFVRAGLVPVDALRAATIVPARAAKRDAASGSIAVGKTADLVVVDGDPLARIGDLRRVKSTMKAGVVYPSRELYETVGVR